MTRDTLTRRAVIATLSTLPLAAVARAAGSAHDFRFPGIDGGEVDLAAFAGRPVLVVNTASQCGYTYQYDGLQAIYDRYRDKGLVVLGVPSDDFGGQELASESEVKEFCEVNFAIDFPMTAIQKVRGRDRHPFYDWAAGVLGENSTPRWNFHKYLVAPDGQLVGAYSSRVEPESPQIVKAVESLL